MKARRQRRGAALVTVLIMMSLMLALSTGGIYASRRLALAGAVATGFSDASREAEARLVFELATLAGSDTLPTGGTRSTLHVNGVWEVKTTATRVGVHLVHVRARASSSLDPGRSAVSAALVHSSAEGRRVVRWLRE